jgi:hypothetical protein
MKAIRASVNFHRLSLRADPVISIDPTAGRWGSFDGGRVGCTLPYSSRDQIPKSMRFFLIYFVGVRAKTMFNSGRRSLGREYSAITKCHFLTV